MITRHHITLALLCTLILTAAGMPGNYLMEAVIISGAVAGSVLPDIHMKKPSRLRLLTAAYYLTRFSECVCLPVMKYLCRNLLNTPVAGRDKRAGHSLMGISSIFVTLTGFAFISVLVGRDLISPVIAGTFLCGVVIGLVIHMIADMCTKKGITPFFPFSEVQISGTIRPCNPDDLRIARFHTGLCLLLIVMVTLAGDSACPEMIRHLTAVLELVLSILTMLYFSKTTMKNGQEITGAAADFPSTAP
jgi:membrane-bound metal-dependent hydrolase YbcI (DUF457 family)